MYKLKMGNLNTKRVNVEVKEEDILKEVVIVDSVDDSECGLVEKVTTKREVILNDFKTLLQQNYGNMDAHNKRIVDIFCHDTLEKGFQQMCLHPETGEPLTYSQLRMLYG